MKVSDGVVLSQKTDLSQYLSIHSSLEVCALTTETTEICNHPDICCNLD